MLTNTTYSIVEHLKTKIGVTAIWVYDGVKLPESAPFITVEQIQTDNQYIAKLRESVQATMRFQVGYTAKSARDRSAVQDRIRDTLHFDEIDYYDTEIAPAQVVGKFQASVTAETPLSPENIADRSQYHRVYFDVEVPTILHRGNRK